MTTPLDRMQTSDTLGGTGSIEQSKRPPAVEGSIREQQSNLQRNQVEKKAEDRFYVDNDYYSLNPWYERDPPRPLFSLGRPFPRTVRPGMLWGRKYGEDQDQQKEGEYQEGQFEQRRSTRALVQSNEHVCLIRTTRTDGQDPPILQISPRIDENGEHHLPPNRFEAEIDGRKFIVTRANYEGATDTEHQYQTKQFDPESNHQGLQSPNMMPDSMGDNFHGDHPPLENDRSINAAQTAETQAEKQDTGNYEQQAIQNYYNTYRNPLARLRARYPEAFAEYLAVSIF